MATDPGAQGPGGSHGDPHQPGQREKKLAFPSSPAESCPSHPCWETGRGGGGPMLSRAGHRHLPGERFGGKDSGIHQWVPERGVCGRKLQHSSHGGAGKAGG